MNIWVVKCRQRLSDGNDGWHWEGYFGNVDSESDDDFHFGGSHWIRSAASKKFLRDDVAVDDVVLCYQYDLSAVVGVTRMASNGQEDPRGSGFNAFDLCTATTAFVIDPPVKIRELRAESCDPRCFGPGTQGTLFPVTRKELGDSLAALERLRPQLAIPYGPKTQPHARSFFTKGLQDTLAQRVRPAPAAF